MLREKLSAISMNGRMAYGIKCVEKFLLTVYPDKNWAILSEKMWPVTNMPWDEWSEAFMEVIPQYLFEFDNYSDSGFEFISEDEYDSFVKLYSGVSDGSKEDDTDPVNFLLHSLFRIEEVYAYTTIPGKGEECLDIIEEIVAILKGASIEVPDVNDFAFSSFDEKDGWGEFFDGKRLSLIL